MRTRAAHACVPMANHVEEKPVENFPVPVSPVAATPATCDKIRDLAYRKWEAAGHPPCDGVQFWLEAELELLHHNDSLATV